MSLIMYQRTEMYKNSISGGALVRPMFTEYPQDRDFQPDMVDTMMFGEALKVDFQFKQGESNKDVVFPSNSNWLEVFFHTFIAVEEQRNVTQFASLNYPMVYQKEGTIIPIQHIIKTGARATSGLKSTPMRLTVLLDKDTTTAAGHVLVEDGKGNQEFYELRATQEVISIKQQNEGMIDDSEANKNLEMIRVAAKPLTLANSNAACAVLNDF